MWHSYRITTSDSEQSLGVWWFGACTQKAKGYAHWNSDIEQKHPGITVIVQPAVNEPDTTPVAWKRLLESQQAKSTPKGLRLTLGEGSETPTGPCRLHPQSSPASVLKVSYFVCKCGLVNIKPHKSAVSRAEVTANIVCGTATPLACRGMYTSPPVDKLTIGN